MNIRPLSEPLQEKAQKELNETPDKLQESLEILKNWLAKQQHLKYKNDDQLLVNLLRCCKYNIERVKQKLDGYYTFRTIAPDLSKDLDPFSPSNQCFIPLIQLALLPLPKNDPASEAMAVLRYENANYDGIAPEQLIKIFVIYLEVLFNVIDNVSVSGTKFIWDFQCIPYKPVLKVTPSMIKKVVHCIQHAYPLRIKGIYCINVPSYCEAVVSLIKYIVPKTIAKRLHFYSTSNLEVIYKEIPKSILPTEYGGEAGPMAELCAKTLHIVTSARAKLIDEDNYYSDESKRLEPSSYVDYMFGLDGTFRKLDID